MLGASLTSATRFAKASKPSCSISQMRRVFWRSPRGPWSLQGRVERDRAKQSQAAAAAARVFAYGARQHADGCADGPFQGEQASVRDVCLLLLLVAQSRACTRPVRPPAPTACVWLQPSQHRSPARMHAPEHVQGGQGEGDELLLCECDTQGHTHDVALDAEVAADQHVEHDLPTGRVLHRLVSQVVDLQGSRRVKDGRGQFSVGSRRVEDGRVPSLGLRFRRPRQTDRQGRGQTG